MKTCQHCEQDIPFSPGNKNYHKYENGYVQCQTELVEARLELLKMDSTIITMEEIDKLVLDERTSLENATLEDIEKRVIDLETTFQVMQKHAKMTKQKKIVALEMYDEKMGKVPKEEIKQLKEKKKIDNTLDDMMATLMKMKGSNISSVEEKKL